MTNTRKRSRILTIKVKSVCVGDIVCHLSNNIKKRNRVKKMINYFMYALSCQMESVWVKLLYVFFSCVKNLVKLILTL